VSSESAEGGARGRRGLAATDVHALVAQLRRLAPFDLEQSRYYGAPTFLAHSPGFHYTLHRRHEQGLGEARTSASGLIVTAEHSGTHIDALCHQAEDMRMYGGCEVNSRVQTSTGFTELGVETIAPLLARGVLLDVARQAGEDRLPPGHLVGADELEQAARADGIEVGEGDVVLVRTGNGALWEDPDEYLRGPGVGADGARWLAERRPLAVGADNVAFDPVGHVDPELGSLPSHVVLIVRNGIYILENLQLEELSRTRTFEFVFLCLPLKMRGATGSPVRPLALTATDRA
jgi:kynurenine formamidase